MTGILGRNKAEATPGFPCHADVTAVPPARHGRLRSCPSMQRDDAFLRAWRDTTGPAGGTTDDEDVTRPPQA